MHENLSAGTYEFSAEYYEHRIFQMRQIAAKHAENFANGASELLCFGFKIFSRKFLKFFEKKLAIYPKVLYDKQVLQMRYVI